MNRPNRARFVVSFALAGLAVTAAGPAGADDLQAKALSRLQTASTEAPRVRFQGGTPRTLRFDVAAVGGTPVEQARQFLDDYGDLFLRDAAPDPRVHGPSLPQVELKARGVWTDGELVNVGFFQRIGGIPVFGGEITVGMVQRLTAGSRVVSVSGALLPSLQGDLDLVPAVLPETAALAAAAHLGRTLPAVLGEPRMMIYAPQIDGGTEAPRLVWALVLGSGTPTEVLVDANKGDVLFQHALEYDSSGFDDYDLQLESAHGAANSVDDNCYYGTTEDETIGDEDGVDADWQDDPDASTLWNNLRQTYKYYHDVHGRHSWDDDDAQIEAYVDSNFAMNNARFVPGCDQFEFTNGMISQDVVAHEITHAVIGSSPSNLVYSDESGALNESFADIFGEASEPSGEWLLGEDLLNNRGPIRSMKSPRLDTCRVIIAPAACGDPDAYSLRCSTTNDYCNFAADKNGVHTNSGIGNYVAWMIAKIDFTATGMRGGGSGEEKMERLAYHVMRYLPSKATYQGAADYYIGTARSWAKYGTNGFTQEDACRVQNAWATVELADFDRDCDYVDDSVDDNDNDGFIDTADNCPDKANPAQDDWDSDGTGDACDPDDDQDGCPDARDLCPEFDNGLCPGLGMLDWDDDGIGNACDLDIDGDGWLNGADNCEVDANPGQEDFNNDGKGDACQANNDGDGIVDEEDNCQFTDNAEQQDSDGDGLGDACDLCPGTPDEIVAWTTGYPEFGIDPKPIQPDSDGDGTPDACDTFGFGRAGWTYGGSPLDPHAGLRPTGRRDTMHLFGDPAVLTVPLGVCGTDAEAYGDNERAQIVVDGLAESAPVSMRIRDERGNLVGRLSPADGVDQRGLRFHPDCLHSYRLEVELGEGFSGDASFLLVFQKVAAGSRNPWAKLNPRHDYVVPVLADADRDGSQDFQDNCVDAFNPEQTDTDRDGVGDACDNCVADANSDQADGDADDVGDVCDNCPTQVNTNQSDADDNGLGDVCDLGGAFRLLRASVGRSATASSGNWQARGEIDSAALATMLAEIDGGGLVVSIDDSVGNVDAFALDGAACATSRGVVACRGEGLQVRIAPGDAPGTSLVRVVARGRDLVVPPLADAPLRVTLSVPGRALLPDSATDCWAGKAKLTCREP